MADKTWMNVTIRAALIGAAVLMYLDLKAEIRIVRADLESKIGTVRVDLGNRIYRVETKIDRVETKIDEVRGYLKFDFAAPSEDPPPAENKQNQPSPPEGNPGTALD